MDRPLVSVLLPTYNGMPWLADAIGSLIAQTVDDWHLVLVDDGSTDETAHFVEQKLGKTDRLTYIWWPENRGIVYALNEGLNACDGRFIARMDSDDLCHCRRFARQLEYLEDHQDYGGCGSWIRFFGDEDRIMTFPTDPAEVRDQLFKRTTVPHPTYFFKRRVYEEFQYDPSFEYAEDVDFLLRVTEKYAISNVPEVLLDYRADYQRCRSCQNTEVQSECIKRARAQARARREIDG